MNCYSNCNNDQYNSYPKYIYSKNKQNDTWKGSYKMKVVKIIIDDKETKALNVNDQNINLLIKIIELFEVKDI